VNELGDWQAAGYKWWNPDNYQTGTYGLVQHPNRGGYTKGVSAFKIMENEWQFDSPTPTLLYEGDFDTKWYWKPSHNYYVHRPLGFGTFYIYETDLVQRFQDYAGATYFYPDAVGGFSVSLDRGGHGDVTRSGDGIYFTPFISRTPGTPVDGGAAIDNLVGDIFDDILEGNDGDDTLEGMEGDDTLVGGTGDDVLDGGVGDDQIDGGDGVDTALYDRWTGDINYARIIKFVETLAGGETADILSATVEGAFIEGGGGDETLTGSAGADSLYGGDGNADVDAGAGDDVVEAGSGQGDDTYEGGDGEDWIVYPSAVNDLVIDLEAGTAVGGPEIGNDDVAGFEHVQGGQGNDTIRGDIQDNILDGHRGGDTLVGGVGFDTLEGGEGADTAYFDGPSTNYELLIEDGRVVVHDTVGTDGADVLSHGETDPPVPYTPLTPPTR